VSSLDSAQALSAKVGRSPWAGPRSHVSAATAAQDRPSELLICQPAFELANVTAANLIANHQSANFDPLNIILGIDRSRDRNLEPQLLVPGFQFIERVARSKLRMIPVEVDNIGIF
jgi:hypothetical protein